MSDCRCERPLEDTPMTVQTIPSQGEILLEIASRLRREPNYRERLHLLNARDLLLRAMGIEPQITILGEVS